MIDKKDTSAKKKGRFSVEDIEFIEQNCEALSPEEIADQLGRSVSSVKSWIEKNVGISNKQKLSLIHISEPTRPY